MNQKVTLTENALKILRKRYLKKDENGVVIETPEEMFARVARSVATAEAKYSDNNKVKRWEEEFYSVMASLEFLPNSPVLMNAGTAIQQMAACFVLPIEDQLEKILDAVKNATLIHKNGGGTGFSFSRIRPRNDIVRSTGGQCPIFVDTTT